MKRTHVVALTLLAVALLAAGSFYAGRQSSTPHEAAAASTPGSAAASAAGERKVLYWHDPMVPGPRFDKPGKSPFMDMQLVPVYADEASDGGVKISPTVQQNLGVRVAPVRRADISASFSAVGSVQFDERLSVAVQTRVAGYVERLAVRASMERVRQGQPLATIFAPEWLAPQNELLALKRAGASEDLLAAARERMRALSIPDSLIRQSEETGTAQARFSLNAPVSGVVAELGVREGAAVTPGMTLFRIAGLEKVWAVAEIPEPQAVRLRPGQKVKAVLQADTSLTFEGELKEIIPQVSASTRTLQARFEVDNKGGKLAPGMLLRLQVAGEGAGPAGLLVPAEAVIRTGKRALVLVRRGDSAFDSRDVAIGREIGDEIEVLQGLQEGEQVVVSGQFLIDSEARLRSVTGSMAAPASAPAASSAHAAPAADLHVGSGKVESVAADSLTISHEPIAALNWPSMTMGFGKPAANAFADVKPGDTVHFEFKKGGPKGWELVSVHRTGGGK